MAEGDYEKLMMILSCQVMQALRYRKSMPQFICADSVRGSCLSDIVCEVKYFRRNQAIIPNLADQVHKTLKSFGILKLVREMESERFLLIDENVASNFCSKVSIKLNALKKEKTAKKRCRSADSYLEAKRQKQESKMICESCNNAAVPLKAFNLEDLNPSTSTQAQRREPKSYNYSIHGTYTLSPGETHIKPNSTVNRGTFVAHGIQNLSTGITRMSNVVGERGTFLVDGIFNPSPGNDHDTYTAQGTYIISHDNDQTGCGTYVAHGTYAPSHDKSWRRNFFAKGTYIISLGEVKFESNCSETHDLMNPYIGTYAAHNIRNPSKNGSKNLVANGSYTLLPDETQFEKADDADDHVRSE